MVILWTGFPGNPTPLALYNGYTLVIDGYTNVMMLLYPATIEWYLTANLTLLFEKVVTEDWLRPWPYTSIVTSCSDMSVMITDDPVCLPMTVYPDIMDTCYVCDKNSKICNFWKFWPVIELINHLSNIGEKSACQVFKRWFKRSAGMSRSCWFVPHT